MNMKLQANLNKFIATIIFLMQLNKFNSHTNIKNICVNVVVWLIWRDYMKLFGLLHIQQNCYNIVNYNNTMVS